MTYGFRFTNDGRRIATGKVTAVCCALDGGRIQAIPIPSIIADQIEVAPG